MYLKCRNWMISYLFWKNFSNMKVTTFKKHEVFCKNMHKKEEKGNIFARLHSLRAHKWLPLAVDRSFKSASSLCTASPPSLLHYSQRLYLIISPSLVNATEMLKSFSGEKNWTNVLTVCMLLIDKKEESMEIWTKEIISFYFLWM